MTTYIRTDARPHDSLRATTLEKNIAPNASGSILISFGHTKVVCAAMLEPKVPNWMRQQNIQGGWLTAEYSMLPYSTTERKQRDSTKGRQDGRTIEIQRLIGRALRAVCDLKKLPGYTLWIDCDVLQADGGTRTASITGAYVAAQLAVQSLIREEKIKENPFRDSVAAISVGVVQETPLLDLCYVEDRDATVDANIVMTGSGEFVEVQMSGEEATFGAEAMDSLLQYARKGIDELQHLQQDSLKD